MKKDKDYSQKTQKITGKILQVAQLGHPVIRQKAKSLTNTEILSKETQDLIDNLIATCNDFNGVGIAAPQVYESKKIFIVWSRSNPRYPKAPNMEPLAVINPKIVKKSKKIVKDWEGCLSVPGIRALVPRPSEIEVEFYDRTGAKKTQKFIDFMARIFQHEYDHLDGIMFIDRAKTRDIITDKEYMKIVNK